VSFEEVTNQPGRRFFVKPARVSEVKTPASPQLVDQAVEMAEIDGLDDEVHHRAAVAGAVNQTILRVLWNSSLVP
jgi:hypothetical protein